MLHVLSFQSLTAGILSGWPAWSARGQSVTEYPDEHRQCPVMAQLVCNQVTLVNSHHSNKVSSSEAIKHGRAGQQTRPAAAIRCLTGNICKHHQGTQQTAAPCHSLMMSTSWSLWMISLARRQTLRDVASDRRESVPAKEVIFGKNKHVRHSGSFTGTVSSLEPGCGGRSPQLTTLCRFLPQEWRFSTKWSKAHASDWNLCRNDVTSSGGGVGMCHQSLFMSLFENITGLTEKSRPCQWVSFTHDWFCSSTSKKCRAE